MDWKLALARILFLFTLVGLSIYVIAKPVRNVTKAENPFECDLNGEWRGHGWHYRIIHEGTNVLMMRHGQVSARATYIDGVLLVVWTEQAGNEWWIGRYVVVDGVMTGCYTRTSEGRFGDKRSIVMFEGKPVKDEIKRCK